MFVLKIEFSKLRSFHIFELKLNVSFKNIKKTMNGKSIDYLQYS